MLLSILLSSSIKMWKSLTNPTLLNEVAVFWYPANYTGVFCDVPGLKDFIEIPIFPL